VTSHPLDPSGPTESDVLTNVLRRDSEVSEPWRRTFMEAVDRRTVDLEESRTASSSSGAVRTPASAPGQQHQCRGARPQERDA
jgi:hypothetical protein